MRCVTLLLICSLAFLVASQDEYGWVKIESDPLLALKEHTIALVDPIDFVFCSFGGLNETLNGTAYYWSNNTWFEVPTNDSFMHPNYIHAWQIFRFQNGTLYAKRVLNGSLLDPAAYSGATAVTAIMNNSTAIILFGGGKLFQGVMEVFTTTRAYVFPSIETFPPSYVTINDAPAARKFHTATPFGEIVVIYGGGEPGENNNFVAVSNTLYFNTSNNEWDGPYNAEGVPPRMAHTAVKLNSTHMLVFGGVNFLAYLNDTWVYNSVTREWKEISTIVAPIEADAPGYENVTGVNNGTHIIPELLPRAGHSAEVVFDRGLGRSFMVVFGGKTYDNKYLNDLWALDLENLVWYLVPSSPETPPARAYHATTLIDGQTFIVWGGEDADKVHDDVYAYTWDDRVEPVPAVQRLDPFTNHMIAVGASVLLLILIIIVIIVKCSEKKI